jgi:hypothetical protein
MLLAAQTAGQFSRTHGLGKLSEPRVAPPRRAFQSLPESSLIGVTRHPKQQAKPAAKNAGNLDSSILFYLS